MGDPGGIGPEVVAATLADPSWRRRCRPIVLGDAEVMRAAVGIVSERLRVRPIGTVDEAVGAPGWIEVLTPAGGEVSGHTWGETSVEGARAALACLAAAASLPFDAIVSAPLCKESLGRAGMRHPDELAMLAELTGSGEPVLVGVLPALWTTCVTSHVPLRAVPELITTPEVLASIRRLAGALTATQPAPRIAVAGLNPHAGESGSLGRGARPDRPGDRARSSRRP